MVGHARDGLGLLDRAGADFEGVECLFELDMLYVGQTHTVAVPLPVTLAGKTTGVTREAIRGAFEARYREAYGRLLDGIPIRLLNLRVAAVGRRPKFDLTLLAPAADADSRTGAPRCTARSMSRVPGTRRRSMSAWRCRSARASRDRRSWSSPTRPSSSSPISWARSTASAISSLSRR